MPAKNKFEAPEWLAECTPVERWVWDQLCQEKIADFNLEEGCKETLSPQSVQGWNDNRVLSSTFLENLLTDEQVSSYLKRYGIRIFGALVKETFNLNNLTICVPLEFQNCRFESTIFGARLHSLFDFFIAYSYIDGEVVLTNAKMDGQVDLLGTKSSGALKMRGVQVKENLFIRAGSNFTSIDLKFARVGGEISLTGLAVTGNLDMNRVQVRGPLFMRDGKFESVDLNGANVGGQLRLTGAKVIGQMLMNNLQVKNSLCMDTGSEFLSVDLIAAKVGGQFNLTGTKVFGALKMNSIQVGQALMMGGGAHFKVVDLTSARVGAQIYLRGSEVTEKLQMNNLYVEDGILMSEEVWKEREISIGKDAKFKVVDLSAARVKGQIDLRGATVTGKLKMTGLKVEQDLIMRKGDKFDTKFETVELLGAQVGGQIDLSGATVTGKLGMNGLKVERGLLMRRGATFSEVELPNANVGIQLSLSEAKITKKLNMTSLHVRGSLYMGRGKFKTVNLYGATIEGFFDFQHSVVQDSMDFRQCSVDYFLDSDNWPSQYKLNGFKYRQLDHSVASRDIGWFQKWLKGQPAEFYELSARLLEEGGDKTKANAIRFSAKEYQRKDALGWQKFVLILQCGLVGYGYKMWRPYYWVLGVTILGTLILIACLPEGNVLPTWWEKSFFTLDTLLPIVELNKEHTEVIPKLPIELRPFFYLIEIFGWVIGSFLVAGLSGLTKK